MSKQVQRRVSAEENATSTNTAASTSNEPRSYHEVTEHAGEASRPPEVRDV